jgi:hypothetical protein
MMTQLLHNLADQEVRRGNADQKLMSLAMEKANGSTGYAQQIYLELRVTQWNREMESMTEEQRELFLRELLWHCEVETTTADRRRTRREWCWTLLCVGSLCVATIDSFYWTNAAAHYSPRTKIYGAIAIVSLVTALVSWIKIRRSQGRDPFGW